jgi:hypothetical protein
MIKSRKGEMRNAYRILIDNPKGKSLLRKMDRKVIPVLR